jgi:hypothetical protein
VAFLIISTPSMFEKTFLPYALNKDNDLTRDPIDCCVKETIQSVIKVIDFVFFSITKFNFVCIIENS